MKMKWIKNSARKNFIEISGIDIHMIIFIFNMNIFYIYGFLYLDIHEVYQNNKKIHLFDVVISLQNHYQAIHQSTDIVFHS
jgi:hypothetical protein